MEAFPALSNLTKPVNPFASTLVKTTVAASPAVPTPPVFTIVAVAIGVYLKFPL